MKTSHAWLAAAIVLSGALWAQAVTPEQLIRQKRTVGDLAAAAKPLQAKLSSEVGKILAAGQLAPFRTLYGEHGVRYEWREPWRMVYTLSRALPYLPAEQQAKVKTYLKAQIAAHAPWDPNLLGPGGTRRQADGLSARVFDADCKPGTTPTPFFPYALWLYGANTGDWATLRANWPTIKANFDKKVGSRPTLETLSGAIGMARLAGQCQDSAAQTKYTALVGSVLAACKDFDTIRANATRVYTGRDQWHRGTDGVLYAFLDLTPEAARVLDDSPALKAGAANYAEQGWKVWPLWWMAEAPVGDGGYYGEGCCAGPQQREMLFNYQAWVAHTPKEKLAYYLDVPDALIGDCSYLNNLMTTIEAFGQSRWAQAGSR